MPIDICLYDPETLQPLELDTPHPVCLLPVPPECRNQLREFWQAWQNQLPPDYPLSLVLYAPGLSPEPFEDTVHDLLLLESTLSAEEEARLYQRASLLLLLSPAPNSFSLLAGLALNKPILALNPDGEAPWQQDIACFSRAAISDCCSTVGLSPSTSQPTHTGSLPRTDLLL